MKLEESLELFAERVAKGEATPDELAFMTEVAKGFRRIDGVKLPDVRRLRRVLDLERL